MTKKYYLIQVIIFISIFTNAQENLEFGQIITSKSDTIEALIKIPFQGIIISDNSIKYTNFNYDELEIKIKDIKQVILGKYNYYVIQYLNKRRVYNGPRKQLEEYSKYHLGRHLGDDKSNIFQIFSSIPLRYPYNLTIYTTYYHIKDNQLYEIKKIIISDKMIDNLSDYPYYKEDDGSIVYMIPDEQPKAPVVNN